MGRAQVRAVVGGAFPGEVHRYDAATKSEEVALIGEPVGYLGLRGRGRDLVLGAATGFGMQDWSAGRIG